MEERELECSFTEYGRIREGKNTVSIEDFEGHVVVAVVEDGGAASSYVKPGDHLLKVKSTGDDYGISLCIGEQSGSD